MIEIINKIKNIFCRKEKFDYSKYKFGCIKGESDDRDIIFEVARDIKCGNYKDRYYLDEKYRAMINKQYNR